MSLRCNIRCILIYAPSKSSFIKQIGCLPTAVGDNGRLHDSDSRDAVWRDVKAGVQLVGSGSDALE
jgi:hypothetical protein